MPRNRARRVLATAASVGAILLLVPSPATAVGPPPTVTGVSPATGLPAGGNRVTVSGTGFVAPAVVTFAGVKATAVTVLSSTSVRAIAPAHAVGRVDVRVGTAAGPSAFTTDDRYAYVDAPAVTEVSPAGGTSAGGNRVTVSGTGFVSPAVVTFGGTPGTAVTVLSPTRLTVTAPAHAGGSVSVRVGTASGASAFTAADRYRYRTYSLAVVAGRCRFRSSGPATAACIAPSSVALDAAGDRYIADTKNNLVEKIAADGRVSVVAGNGLAPHFFGGCGPPRPGPATSSPLCYPQGITLDAAGNLYIADTGHFDVEKVTPDGTLSILAGRDSDGMPTPGPAIRSKLRYPVGVAVDAAGAVYIADREYPGVEKVTPDGTLSIVAGNGKRGHPTPGPAAGSSLNLVAGIALDTAGNLYVGDQGENVVEKITPDGVLTIVPGSDLDSVGDVAVDSAGNVLVSDDADSTVDKITPDGTVLVVAGTGHPGGPTQGPARSSALEYPGGLAFDPAGNLYVAVPGYRDAYFGTGTGNGVLVNVTPGGTLSIVAGTAGYGPRPPAPATISDLSNPEAVAVDAAGDLYIADTGHDRIAKVTPDGTLSVVAGTGREGSPSPGPAAASDLDGPQGVALDSAGDLYISDTGNNTVEKVTPDGTLSIVGRTPFPPGGPPKPGFRQDGPTGLVVDPSGDVYFADQGNGDVVKMSRDGTSSTVTSALDYPQGLALDAAGDLYVADTGNDQVMKITPDGTVYVVAGDGISCDLTSGPATSAGLCGASGVAVDAAGDLYITDAADDVVSTVTPDGTLSIFAGTGNQGAPTPGTAASSDLQNPAGVAVDAAGAVYIADAYNDDVEKVTSP